MVAILLAMILIVTIGLAVIAYFSRPEQKPVRIREREWWENVDTY